MSKPFPILVPPPRPIVSDVFDGAGEGQFILTKSQDAFVQCATKDRQQPMIVPARRVVFFCFSQEDRTITGLGSPALALLTATPWETVEGLAADPSIIGTGDEGNGTPYPSPNPPTTLFDNGVFSFESGLNTFGSFLFLSGGPYWSFLGWTAKRWQDRAVEDGYLFCDMVQFRLPETMHYLIVTASSIGNTLDISGAATAFPNVNQDLYTDIRLTTEADGLKGDIITIPVPEDDPANIPAYDPLLGEFGQLIDGYGIVSYFVPEVTWAEYKAIYGIP